jgi:hypothetical protein
MGGKHVSKLFACMNMVGNLGSGSIILAVPYFLKQTQQWESVLYMFSGLWLAAGVFWMLLNPNGDVFRYSLLRRSAVRTDATNATDGTSI